MLIPLLSNLGFAGGDGSAIPAPVLHLQLGVVDTSVRCVVNDTTPRATLEAPLMIVRQNDTFPPVTADLLVDGVIPTDPLGGSVQFRLVDEDGDVVFTNAATIVDPDTWSVQYNWQVGDTAVRGMYDGYWIVTFVGGLVCTWPTIGSQRVKID